MPWPFLCHRCKFLREKDRSCHEYPQLQYPELYVLKGGYREFFLQFPVSLVSPRWQEGSEGGTGRRGGAALALSILPAMGGRVQGRDGGCAAGNDGAVGCRATASPGTTGPWNTRRSGRSCANSAGRAGATGGRSWSAGGTCEHPTGALEPRLREEFRDMPRLGLVR